MPSSSIHVAANSRITLNIVFNFLNQSLIDYNIVLVSGVQESDSVIYIHIFLAFFFRFLSLIYYYKILSIVHCAIW